ncbi:MAG: hypothetical protein DWQ53_09730 [Microcystis flos-aquae DF17]|nr:MAG: hypothetical protein DWQ53_09730 [Microcystis flos-aquae DF17]
MIPRIILNALTTADNSWRDVIRCGMVVTGATMIGLTAWAVIVGREPFNALDFGGGAALIFGGGGFGLAAKAGGENSRVV